MGCLFENKTILRMELLVLSTIYASFVLAFSPAFGANAAERRKNKQGADDVLLRLHPLQKEKPLKRHFFNPASPLLFQLSISTRGSKRHRRTK
ncbi:hypothetical protein KSP40_PGU015033 [Platanthera guangdongensis]|uniref:Secreted protein n=1 Tax=Platanthera guangdongensis TaxID=2320717 RepID=A0ABR2LJU3_9ASPA